MSRIGKLKRQAIQEANERNLGLIKEQTSQVTVPFREGDVIQFDDGFTVQLDEDPNVGDTLFVILCDLDGIRREYQTGFLGSGPTTKENEWCSQGSAEVDCHSNPQIVDISACKNAR